MQTVTVGDIAAAIALIAGILGGLGVILRFLSSHVSKWLRGELKPLADKIDAVGEKVDDEGIERCKDFIVRTLADVEHGESVTKEELQRFYENYEQYISTGHNGYIKKQVDDLKKAGKL